MIVPVRIRLCPAQPRTLSSACIRLQRSAEEGHIVGMPATERGVTTIAELLALPEDGMRHELLDGVHVVTPAPALPHQRVVTELIYQLRTALQGGEDAEVFTSPADIMLGPDTLVQPDVFVVSLRQGDRLRSWSDVGVPPLVIEVLSPATAPRDRGAKRRIYQRAGVAQYWIVDLDARLVERWAPEDTRPEICDSVIEWSVPGDSPLQIDLPRLFQAV
jgi:Uma2 family endonuclease